MQSLLSSSLHRLYMQHNSRVTGSSGTRQAPIHDVLDDVLLHIVSHLTRPELIVFTHLDSTLRRRITGLPVLWLDIKINSIADRALNRFFAFLERSQTAGIRMRVDIRHHTAAAVKVLMPVIAKHIGHTRLLWIKVPLQFQKETLAALTAPAPLLEEASIQFYNDSFFVTDTTCSTLAAELPVALFGYIAPHLRVLRLDNLCLPLAQIPALRGLRELVYAYDSDTGLDARVFAYRLPSLEKLSIVVGYVQPEAENIIAGPVQPNLQSLAVYFKPDLSVPSTHAMLLDALSHRHIPRVALHGVHGFRTVDLESFMNPHIDGCPSSSTRASAIVTRERPTDVPFLSVLGGMDEGFRVALSSLDTGRERSLTYWLAGSFVAHREAEPYDLSALHLLQTSSYELSAYIVELDFSAHELTAWQTAVQACDPAKESVKSPNFRHVRRLTLLWAYPPGTTGELMPPGRIDMPALETVIVGGKTCAIVETLRSRELVIWDLVQRLGASCGTPIMEFMLLD